MTSSPEGPLVFERDFHAPAAELRRAWLEPERLRRWFRPVAGVEAEVLTLEARDGGALALSFPVPQGRIRLAGRFRELASERILLDLARHDGGTDAGAGPLWTRVSVVFEPRPGGTRLVLRHEGLEPPERALYAGAWEACLRRLAGACEESLTHFYGRQERYPRFRSRFGGLWPDLTNAAELLAGKQSLGLLDAADAALFRHWIEHGFVVLPGAVPSNAADTLRTEMDEAWERGDARVEVEYLEGGQRRFGRLDPKRRDVPHKVLDYHGLSHAARAVQFAPAIRRFLERLFERPPMAFQSLFFRFGTEQDMHQDTAYVVLRSPMELVGCWIALEDVQPGSGELQYYVGSHRIPEYLFFGRGRARPYQFEDDADFLRHVRVESERLGCPLQRFRPRKGDALLWHADLVHGGARREVPGLTRQSLVSHFCPLDVDPEWFGTIPSSPKLEHAPGCHYCHPLHAERGQA